MRIIKIKSSTTDIGATSPSESGSLSENKISSSANYKTGDTVPSDQSKNCWKTNPDQDDGPTITQLLLIGLQSSDPNTLKSFQDFAVRLKYELSQEDFNKAILSSSQTVKLFALEQDNHLTQEQISLLMSCNSTEVKIAISKRDDIVLTEEHYTQAIKDADPQVTMSFVKRRNYFPTAEQVTLASNHKSFVVRCFFEQWKWMAD